MKMILGLSALLLLTVGCNKIEGTLNLTEAVKLKSTKGVVRTIKPQSYSADIKLKSKKSITLRLENDSDEKYEFKIPSNKPIPNNGDFAFSANEVGQPVDLTGSVKTSVTRSDTVTGWESCQYQDWQTVCNSGPDGRPICTTVPVTRTGQQFVRYYIETIEKDVLMTIKAQGSDVSSGDFVGDIAYSNKVYTEQWGCR